MMHSYVYIGGQFVGNGFKIAPDRCGCDVFGYCTMACFCCSGGEMGPDMAHPNEAHTHLDSWMYLMHLL